MDPTNINEEQEEFMREIIAGEEDPTSLYLNESGDGVEGEDDGSGRTLVITKSGEVYKLRRCWVDALTDLYLYIDG